MGLLHLFFKVLATLSPLTGLVMLGAGLGLMALPAELSNVGGSPDGANKFAWFAAEASAATGRAITEQQGILFIAACKLAAVFDLWVTKLVPRLALVCLCILVTGALYSHVLLGDDVFGPLAVLLINLVTLLTWPKKGGAKSAVKAGKAAKKKSPKAS